MSLHQQQEPVEPLFTLTEPACAYVREFLQPLKPGKGFRVAIKKSGCSGFSYLLDIVEKSQDDDICWEQDGVPIFADADCASRIRGSIVELVDKGMGQKQLIFNNPQVADFCGCGESFVMKESN